MKSTTRLPQENRECRSAASRRISRRRKSVPVIAAAAGIALAAGACSSSTSSDSDKTTLVVWQAGGPLYDKAIAPVLADFKKQEPNVTVKVQAVDWATFQQRVLTSAAANDLPCVMYTNSQVEPAIAAANVMDPVPSSIIDDEQLKQYLPGFLDSLKSVDGKQLFVPFLGGADMFYINTDTPAGDAQPKTYSDWVTMAKKAVKYDANGNIAREGIGWRWTTPGPGWLTFQYSSMVQAAGGQFLDGDNGPKAKKALFNSDAGLTVLQFMHDTIWKDKVSLPPNKQPTDKKNAILGWLAGQQASTYAGPWMPNALATLATGQYAGINSTWNSVYLTPQPDVGGRDVVTVDTDGWGVPRSCKNKDLAWKFIKTLTSKESNINFFKVYQHPVARIDAMVSDEVSSFMTKTFPAAKNEQELWKSAALQAATVPEVHHPYNQDIFKAVEDRIIGAMNDKNANLQSTLDDMAKDVERILGR